MSAPEPYTIVDMVKGNEINYVVADNRIHKLPTPLHQFHIYYRNYSRVQHFIVNAKDELEAFTLAMQRLDKTKKHYDKYGKGAKR